MIPNDEFERSQQACLIGVADFYPVVKLTYNGHELITKGLTEMSLLFDEARFDAVPN